MTTLSITPSRFIASNGKLDSNRRYIFQQSVGVPLFFFPRSTTIDLPLRGIVYSSPGFRTVSGPDSGFVAAHIPMSS